MSEQQQEQQPEQQPSLAPEQQPLLAPEQPAEQPTEQPATMDTTPDATEAPQETWADIPEEIMACGTDEILSRIRLIENDIKVLYLLATHKFNDFLTSESPKVMRSETLRLQHEQSVMKEKIRDNKEKIKQNKVLPYLVGNVVEVRTTTVIGTSQHFTQLSPRRF